MPMTDRTCYHCSETKPLSEFPRKKSSKDGISGMCHVCNRAKVRAWRLANPDKYKEANLNWRQNNAERKRKNGREWYQNNRDRHKACGRAWAQQNRDKTRKALREWSQRNPDKVLAAVNKRRTALMNRCGLLTPEKEAQILAIYAEARRLTRETGVPHHVDHIAPLRGKTVSGLHVPQNLRIMPAFENMSKGAKVDYDLLAQHTMSGWF